MDTVTIAKNEYRKILENQRELSVGLANLRRFMLEAFREELQPSVIARLEKTSLALDRGRGKSFKSLNSLKSYLSSL